MMVISEQYIDELIESYKGVELNLPSNPSQFISLEEFEDKEKVWK